MTERLPGPVDVAGRHGQIEAGAPRGNVVGPPSQAGVEPTPRDVEPAGLDRQVRPPEPDPIVARVGFLEDVPHPLDRGRRGVEAVELHQHVRGGGGVGPGLDDRPSRVPGPPLVPVEELQGEERFLLRRIGQVAERVSKQLLGAREPARVHGQHAALHGRAGGERRSRRHAIPGRHRGGASPAIQLAEAELVLHLALTARRQAGEAPPGVLIPALGHLPPGLVEPRPQPQGLPRANPAPGRHRGHTAHEHDRRPEPSPQHPALPPRRGPRTDPGGDFPPPL
jgi:hypothetical protein